MLDERVLVEKLEELVARDEVVVFAMFLAGPGQAGGVCALCTASSGTAAGNSPGEWNVTHGKR